MSRTGLFDSHAHMDSDYFTDDRDALLTQLQEELDGIINPGCDEITSGFAVSLAEKYDFMYAAVAGILKTLRVFWITAILTGWQPGPSIPR